MTSPHTPAHIPLVEATRGGFIESVHYGSFVAIGTDGDVLFEGGEPQHPVFPRSSLKPLQSAAMVALGLVLPPELLALWAASHSGSEKHLAGVDGILALHGLYDAALQPTPAAPCFDRATSASNAPTVQCFGA